jgi:hypothetical protein
MKMSKEENALAKYISENCKNIDFDLRVMDAEILTVADISVSTDLSMKKLNDSDVYSFSGCAEFNFKEQSLNERHFLCRMSGDTKFVVSSNEDYVFEIIGKVRVSTK